MTQNPEKPNKISNSRQRNRAGFRRFGVNSAETCAQFDTKLAQPCSRDVLPNNKLECYRYRGPSPFIPPSPLLVFEDDDGRYRYSLADEAPSFETVPFALAVAAQELQRSIGARQ